MNPILPATINGEAVGQLTDEGEYWIFQYAESWRQGSLAKYLLNSTYIHRYGRTIL